MKTFYGGIFIEKEKLKDAGIYHPIKLEYYKRTNEEVIITQEKSRYGIEIIKTEYLEKEVKIEKKEIEYLTNDERKVDKVLDIFKGNAVTPINAEEIIHDLAKKLF